MVSEAGYTTLPHHPYPADPLPCEPGTEEHARSRDLQSQDAEGLRKSSEDALGRRLAGKRGEKDQDQP